MYECVLSRTSYPPPPPVWTHSQLVSDRRRYRAGSIPFRPFSRERRVWIGISFYSRVRPRIGAQRLGHVLAIVAYGSPWRTFIISVSSAQLISTLFFTSFSLFFSSFLRSLFHADSSAFIFREECGWSGFRRQICLICVRPLENQ